MGLIDEFRVFSMLRSAYLSPQAGPRRPGGRRFCHGHQVLIAFYSRNGATEALAKAIAEGAQAEGAEVRLRRAREHVGPDIIDNVPGWKENMERMNAPMRRRPRTTWSGPTRSCSARRRASA